MMEESDQSGDSDSSFIPDSSEDKCLSSDSDGSSQLECVDSLQLPHDMIAELGKYLDVDAMQSARMVSTAWHKGLEDEFRRKIMLVVQSIDSQPMEEFFKTFSSSKLITSNVWIKEPLYLDDELMTNWIQTYGQQLSTLKLGNFDFEDAMDEELQENVLVISPKWIESILTCHCPNIKVLKILTPAVSEHSPIKYANPDAKDVTMNLDYLEIGHEENLGHKWDLKLLLNVLSCVKSLKSLKIVGVEEVNSIADHINDDSAKQIFEKIEELDLLCTTVDPRRFFQGPDDMRFTNLQKLRVGCFSINYRDESPVELMRYLPALLTSVKDHLKELTFYQCSAEHEDRVKFVCSKIEDCILSPMPKLEIFQIIDIVIWRKPSLDFLEKLPALKQLHITMDYSYTDDDSDEQCCSEHLPPIRKLQEVFNVNKSKKQIVHPNLEQLTYRCCTNSSKVLKNIRFCFPNLKRLEIDFGGTLLYSVFGTFKKLKDLTIHLCESFDSLDADDLEELSGSCVEKLCLKNDTSSKLLIRLGPIVDGCLAADSLKKLELTGKIRRKDYETAMEQLKTAELQLWLINCKIIDN